jgi:hypothetical protein
MKVTDPGLILDADGLTVRSGEGHIVGYKAYDSDEVISRGTLILGVGATSERNVYIQTPEQAKVHAR